MLMSKPLVSGLLLGFLLGFSFFYLLSNYAPRINRTPQVQRELLDTTTRRKRPAPTTGHPPLESLLPTGLSLVKNPPIVITSNMPVAAAEKSFYAYVTQTGVKCNKQTRLGHSDDGGWNMCTVPPFEPTKSCLSYSFGINNDWSFDDAISKRYNCTVKAFDPSMKIGDHKHSSKVFFYHTGIGGADRTNPKGWKMRTLPTLLRELDDSNKIIDYLKIDVEYSEWESFKPILASGILHRVRQFGFEIHTAEVNSKSTTSAQFAEYYEILAGLERQGFRRWYVHFNRYGKYFSTRTHQTRTCCYEMVYINMNFLRKIPT